MTAPWTGDVIQYTFKGRTLTFKVIDAMRVGERVELKVKPYYSSTTLYRVMWPNEHIHIIKKWGKKSMFSLLTRRKK